MYLLSNIVPSTIGGTPVPAPARGWWDADGCRAEAGSQGERMTYVVTDNCIKCKYMDCVEVCRSTASRRREMLVIHPDECIDCGVCVPECPAERSSPTPTPRHAGMAGAQPRCMVGVAEHNAQEDDRRRRRRRMDGVRASSTPISAASPRRVNRRRRRSENFSII